MPNKLIEEDIRVRIYLSEQEKVHGRSLYELIVMKSKELGLAGATVLRGIMGFGADRKDHNAKFLELSENLPIVVEIVDTELKINTLLPYLDEVVNKGFVTLETVKVLRYR